LSCTVKAGIADIGTDETVIVFFNKTVIVFLVRFGTGETGIGKQIMPVLDEKLINKFGAIIWMELQDRERQPCQEKVKTIFHRREGIAIDSGNFTPTCSHID